MSLLDRRTRIWKEGETTNPFVTPQLSFSKEKRFKLYSIYWPEKSQSKGQIKVSKSPTDLEAYRISKLIDEQQKNESRMNKNSFNSTRREIRSSEPKNGFSNFRPAKTTSLSKHNQRVVERLASTSEIRQSKLRDRHGNRTNLLQNQQEQCLHLELFREEPKFRGTQTGFYTSRRMRLDLPHNYYPGPGNYDIKRYLESQQNKSKTLDRKTSKEV